MKESNSRGNGSSPAGRQWENCPLPRPCSCEGDLAGGGQRGRGGRPPTDAGVKGEREVPVVIVFLKRSTSRGDRKATFASR